MEVPSSFGHDAPSILAAEYFEIGHNHATATGVSDGTYLGKNQTKAQHKLLFLLCQEREERERKRKEKEKRKLEVKLWQKREKIGSSPAGSRESNPRPQQTRLGCSHFFSASAKASLPNSFFPFPSTFRMHLTRTIRLNPKNPFFETRGQPADYLKRKNTIAKCRFTFKKSM